MTAFASSWCWVIDEPRFEQAHERVLADVLHFAGELVARGCLEFSEP
jgi:hypothetical protein